MKKKTKKASTSLKKTEDIVIEKEAQQKGNRPEEFSGRELYEMGFSERKARFGLELASMEDLREKLSKKFPKKTEDEILELLPGKRNIYLKKATNLRINGIRVYGKLLVTEAEHNNIASILSYRKNHDQKQISGQMTDKLNQTIDLDNLKAYTY